MERELIEWLHKHLPASPQAPLAISDDAAVLSWTTGGDVVVTTDAITDGVDFHLADVLPEQVGHKALGVNLSDLAAMAAQPVAAVVALMLPRSGALELAIGLYRGILPLAARFDLAIVGGDTNTWDGPLAISITAIGRTSQRGPLTRSGAQVGDALLVTGALGGSLLGRHLAVEPRVREAIGLHAKYDLHAGMDISDGLALDASRLAEASNCGAAIDLLRIPITADAERMAATSGGTPLEHALGDGEDFELLLAAPPAEAERMIRDRPIDVQLTRIGEFVAKRGLWKRDAVGNLEPLAPIGYQH
jgi:thiamine-monophosphate kinase